MVKSEQRQDWKKAKAAAKPHLQGAKFKDSLGPLLDTLYTEQVKFYSVYKEMGKHADKIDATQKKIAVAANGYAAKLVELEEQASDKNAKKAIGHLKENAAHLASEGKRDDTKRRYLAMWKNL